MNGRQHFIGCQTGIPTETTCPIVVCSLNAGNAIVSVAGVGSFSVTLSACGEDRSVKTGVWAQAGYVGNVMITGLAAFTRYTYTVTQNGNTETGAFLTEASKNDDVTFFVTSCDASNAGDPVTGNAWTQMRAYAEANPNKVAGVIFTDDHGYPDKQTLTTDSVTGHAFDTSQTAHSVVGSPKYAYNYCLCYLNRFGLFGDASDSGIAWGQDDDRNWCMRNLNYYPQMGDHEFNDDMGLDNGTADRANAFVGATPGWVIGIAAWDLFMAPLQNSTHLDTDNSYAIAFNIGGVQVVMPEIVSVGDGSVTSLPAYGNDQIDDCLTAMDNDQPFKVLIPSTGIRIVAPYVDGDATIDYGSQNSITLYPALRPEHHRLVSNSGQSPKSVMDNSKTNGTEGTFLMVYGDWHNHAVYQNKTLTTDITGNVTGLDENYSLVCVGGANAGEGNRNLNDSVLDTYANKTWYDGVEILSLRPEANSNAYRYWTVNRFDYIASKPHKLRCMITDENGDEVWSGSWHHQRTGNEVIGYDEKVGESSGIGFGEQ